MSDHIVSAYDKDLKGLARSIAEMGGLAEHLIDEGHPTAEAEQRADPGVGG